MVRHYGNETGCKIAGGAWSNPGGAGTCGQPGTVIHIASNTHADTSADCHTNTAGGDNHSHAFNAGTDVNGNGDYTDPDDAPPSCT